MDNNENEVNENVENTSNEVKQEDPIKTETKTDNNEPIKEKKKTNVGLIVTIIILSVIIVIGLFVGLGIFVFNKFKATLNNTPINDITSMIQEGENQLADAEATLNNSLENAGLNDVFGTLTNAVDNGTTVQPSSNARTSSLENPLKVGEWGIASKYNTNTRSDQNVNVKVTNIIRGDEAKKMAQEEKQEALYTVNKNEIERFNKLQNSLNTNRSDQDRYRKLLEELSKKDITDTRVWQEITNLQNTLATLRENEIILKNGSNRKSFN